MSDQPAEADGPNDDQISAADAIVSTDEQDPVDQDDPLASLDDGSEDPPGEPQTSPTD